MKKIFILIVTVFFCSSQFSLAEGLEIDAPNFNPSEFTNNSKTKIQSAKEKGMEKLKETREI